MKRRLRRAIGSTTTQLAGTYLLIIMCMSIGFSVVFYNTSSNALGRQVPPNDNMFRQNIGQTGDQTPPTEIRDFLNRRAIEGRQDLLLRLIILNSAALIAGGALSYYLARRTLRPIEQAMEAQAQFVSDASHELRTPLAAIRTSNDVALRDSKLTLAKAKTVITENTEEVIKLKQLSDGLLDLATNERTSRHLQAVALQDVVSDAINQVIPLAQAKHIAIDDNTAQLMVTSDSAVLSQILVILLDNAIKYSLDHSTIHISTSAKGNTTFLHVRDEGIGIRASDLPHIFRRFYRADTVRGQGSRHGYGLGLAIADTLARSHESRLSVTSELGTGTTFSIRLKKA